jgi:hypothetical protein
MPYSIKTKDGITINNIPDDVAPDSQVLKDRVAKIRAEGAPAAAPQRSGLETAGRVVGLTARHGIEGVAGGLGAFIDPAIGAIKGVVRMAGAENYDPVTVAGIGRGAADMLGLPKPETQGERIVGAMTRGLAGGASGAASMGQLANQTGGAVQAGARQLAAQPVMQAVAGGSAGAAGQSVAEGGGGPGAQLAAALAAGVATPMAAATAARARQVPTATVSPEQQAILEAGKRANVPVLTSDVIPPKTFMGKQAQAVGERIPIAGTGGVRQAQQTTRQDAVSEIAQKYGTPSYEAIVSSVKGKVGAIKKAAGRVIDKSGQQLDSAGPVTPSQSLAAIDDAIAKLSRPNVFNPAAAKHIDDLTELRDVLGSGQQVFSTLRQSRTAVKEMLDAVDPGGRSQLPTFSKALVTRVYGAMKGDMDSFANANLTPRQAAQLAKANKVYGDEARLLSQSRLKNVLDKGEMTPEVVRNMIYSNKPSENRILYDSLGTAGRQQVKAALIDDAATKALRSGEINPNAFGSELAKHGKKLDVFFQGQERDSIKGLIRLMQVTRRAQDAAAAPTTTGAIGLPYAMGAAALADLGATITTAVAAGRLARAYESAPVRDLLLKISSTRPGTRAEGEYARALAAAMREELPRQEQEQPTEVAP